MSPRTKREMKSGSVGSKKPKLYEIASPVRGSATNTESWPKRSQKISPGCMTMMPTRGAASAVAGGAASMGEGAGAPCANAPSDTSQSTPASSQRFRKPALPPATGRDPFASRIAEHVDVERMHAARVCRGDPEHEAAHREFLAGFRQMANGRRDQATDGVVLVVVEVGVEALVEVRDRRQCVDHEQAIGLGAHQRLRVLGFVVLVVDVADDLLEYVLDGDQPGDAAVLVDHDRHVVARLAELAQQHVEALGFGNQHGRTQQGMDAARAVVGDDPAQQILGQQDAEDFVLL